MMPVFLFREDISQGMVFSITPKLLLLRDNQWLSWYINSAVATFDFEKCQFWSLAFYYRRSLIRSWSWWDRKGCLLVSLFDSILCIYLTIVSPILTPSVFSCLISERWPVSIIGLLRLRSLSIIARLPRSQSRSIELNRWYCRQTRKDKVWGHKRASLSVTSNRFSYK